MDRIESELINFIKSRDNAIDIHELIDGVKANYEKNVGSVDKISDKDIMLLIYDYLDVNKLHFTSDRRLAWATSNTPTPDNIPVSEQESSNEKKQVAKGRLGRKKKTTSKRKPAAKKKNVATKHERISALRTRYTFRKKISAKNTENTKG